MTLTNLLLWFTILSVGVMAGVYFTFSAFVMRSLDAIGRPAGMLAMQSINRVIVRSVFLPLFFGSTLAAAVLAVMALLDMAQAGAMWLLAGSATYVIGMFVVTVVGNVPLNNALEAASADSEEGEAMWQRYMSRWVAWNHVRTAACTLSLGFLVAALVERA